MMFNRKKKEIERLNSSFGRLKDDTFDFEVISKYFRYKDNSKTFQIISDKTCNDLDFAEIFMFLDRTNSKVGQQYLYNRLRTISGIDQSTPLNEEIIALLLKDENLRISVQKQLEKLQKHDVYHISTLFQEEHLSPPKWFFIIKLLSFTSVVSLILIFFDLQFIFVLIGVFIVNLGIHFWNKKNLFQYLRSIPQLLRLNSVASNLYKTEQLKKVNPTISGSIKTVDQVRNRMSFFQLETRLQGDLESIVWMFFELFKTMFLLEPLILFGVLGRLDAKRTEIETVFQFVGHIDMLVSIASLRKGLETYCIPEINEGKPRIDACQIYHPLIKNCKANNIVVSEKSVLLTGSNMSGKTSFIRTIGLNVIAGLTINTCFAKSLSIPLVRVFSAIRISDDLINDKSYYFEEVLTIKEMISESEMIKPNLFLLDEIFKGTNTIERIAAGKAVLSSLSKNNNIVFVSTHDIELADMLSEEYKLFYFSESVDNKTVDFDYKLKKGKLKNRNAICILEINDYPDSVVKEAFAIAEKLDNIAAINKKDKKLGSCDFDQMP